MDSNSRLETVPAICGSLAAERCDSVHNETVVKLLLILVSLLYPVTLTAIEIQANANVTITPALSITEVKPVSFGSIASGNGRCSMNKDGELSGSSQLCSGDGSPGLLELKGEHGSIVSIHMRSGSEADITFTPTAFNSGSIMLDDGVIQIPVGGNLDLNSPETGRYTIPFEVIANYE